MKLVNEELERGRPGLGDGCGSKDAEGSSCAEGGDDMGGRGRGGGALSPLC